MAVSLISKDRLRKVARQAAMRVVPKGLILMYHRIGEPVLDPWSLHVSPKHFQEQMEVLQKLAKPMSLRELAQSQKDGRISDRAVAVTFDDGYADNLYQGKPILERYNIPATFFIATGHIGKTINFWWDGLQQLLLQPGTLPERLTINIDGNSYTWDLGTAVNYTEADLQRDKGQKVWESKPGTRFNFYYLVWQSVRTLPEQGILEAMQQIQAWVGREVVATPEDRSLQPDEILTLGSGRLAEIGAHTVNHPSLAEHSSAYQQQEIQQSKADLEKLLNRPVTTFAYPYGSFVGETMTLAEQAGLECACSTVENVVWFRSQTYRLPRYHVHDWNGEEFAAEIEKWFKGE
jgi:peptidoglycan/xylan/chitin deacetylase (PgdA/CDA1 family)